MADDEDYYDSSDGDSYFDEDEATNRDDLVVGELVGGKNPVVANDENQQRYVVLSEQEIRQRVREEAAATAEVFSVPVDWALVLLVHYRWNTPRLHEDWFSDRDRIRNAAGLVRIRADEEEQEEEMMSCGICAEEGKPASEMASAGCAHRYCHDCWRRYVAAAVEDGRCLALRCPDASCSRAVLCGMVKRFLLTATGEEEEDVYERLLARDHVDARGMKPCPAPGCDRVIEVTTPLPLPRDADVACACGNGFCWRCGGAAHWPSSCAAAARMWTREADAASADWILLHTKPCPRCRRRIQRVVDPNSCRYMTCAAPCFHAFCWHCLGPTECSFWNHDLCYDVTSAGTEAEARHALDRSLHYQHLWAANLREAKRIAKLTKLLPPETEGRNKGRVAAAWEVVAEGRRVLGNACVHGLGLRGATTRRRELFEYQHGEAEAMLGRLQEAAAAEDLDEVLGDYRACNQLQALTQATQRCLDNLAKAVQEEIA